MVLFTLLFAILIKSQICQSVSISFLAGINACLKNIECVTELHEISIDDHGTRQGPYIGRHSLEQACLQRISSRYSSRRNNGGDPFLMMT
ncbi:hypothetical protein YC2023_080648 [Brassica napus]